MFRTFATSCNTLTRATRIGGLWIRASAQRKIGLKSNIDHGRMPSPLTLKLTNMHPSQIMKMNRNLLFQWSAALCGGFTLTTASAFAQQATDKLTEEEARQLGIEAVVYGFPLVIVDVTKRVQTNVAEPKEGGHAPVNQFSNFLKYPTAAY